MCHYVCMCACMYVPQNMKLRRLVHWQQWQTFAQTMPSCSRHNCAACNFAAFLLLLPMPGWYSTLFKITYDIIAPRVTTLQNTPNSLTSPVALTWITCTKLTQNVRFVFQNKSTVIEQKLAHVGTVLNYHIASHQYGRGPTFSKLLRKIFGGFLILGKS